MKHIYLQKSFFYCSREEPLYKYELVDFVFLQKKNKSFKQWNIGQSSELEYI